MQQQLTFVNIPLPYLFQRFQVLLLKGNHVCSAGHLGAHQWEKRSWPPTSWKPPSRRLQPLLPLSRSLSVASSCSGRRPGGLIRVRALWCLHRLQCPGGAPQGWLGPMGWGGFFCQFHWAGCHWGECHLKRRAALARLRLPAAADTATPPGAAHTSRWPEGSRRQRPMSSNVLGADRFSQVWRSS